MKTVVIDASIILRFLLEDNERIKDRVSALLREAEKRKLLLISTPLIQLEVSNGLRFTLKKQEFADDVLKQFLQLPITIMQLTATQIQKTLSVSYKLGTTVYDTSYHLVAIAINCTLITSDKAYFDRAKTLGKIEYVG